MALSRSEHGKKMEKAQNPIFFAAVFPLQRPSNSGVQAAWFATWWFDVKCMHLMTLLSLCPWIFARLQPHKLWCTMIILTKHDGSHDSMVHIIACPRTAKVTKDWCDPTRFHWPQNSSEKRQTWERFSTNLEPNDLQKPWMLHCQYCQTAKSAVSRPRNRSDLQWAITQY